MRDPRPLTDPSHRPGCPALPAGDLWVFAYGSLMWDPGFEYLRVAPALLRGYHRAFCIASARYRGTPEEPGLVLGLDRGGACRGLAYQVAAQRVDDVLALLWEREMSRLTYRVRMVPLVLSGATVQALAFVADPAHENYAGGLTLEAIAERIARCRGTRGANMDYLLNTLRHLDELGMHDARLHRILTLVRGFQQRRDHSDPRDTILG